jgi:hypothetical protein
MEEYDRLRAIEDKVWGAKADAAVLGGLATDEEAAVVLRRLGSEG